MCDAIPDSMHRNVVASIVVALALAGCLQQTPDEPAPPQDESAEMPSAEPVSIRVDEPLLQGYPEETWSFEVKPSGEGRVTAAVRGINDQVSQRHTGPICFEFLVEHANGGRESTQQCGGTNIVLGTGGNTVLADKVFNGTTDATVTIKFSAQPQVARFTLDADVAYE